MNRPVPDVVDQALASAVRAPSPHNTQPWRFVVEHDLIANRSPETPSLRTCRCTTCTRSTPPPGSRRSRRRRAPTTSGSTSGPCGCSFEAAVRAAAPDVTGVRVVRLYRIGRGPPAGRAS